MILIAPVWNGKGGDGRLEGWKDGRMEGWKDGRIGRWKDGRMEGLEGWKGGRVEGWKDGRVVEECSYRTSLLSEPRFLKWLMFTLLLT